MAPSRSERMVTRPTRPSGVARQRVAASQARRSPKVVAGALVAGVAALVGILVARFTEAPWASSDEAASSLSAPATTAQPLWADAPAALAEAAPVVAPTLAPSDAPPAAPPLFAPPDAAPAPRAVAKKPRPATPSSRPARQAQTEPKTVSKPNAPDAPDPGPF